MEDDAVVCERNGFTRCAKEGAAARGSEERRWAARLVGEACVRAEYGLELREGARGTRTAGLEGTRCD
ncbi:hypothetical protein BDY17DRAFT_171602 [Neohortaea acidophila]|uniref:Uncharacterized protein n=1 Tax=Neohortaea acidophila TaxID=245834 RepID=A0A6A6PPT1_9PEZI|nr:uncharacterized protein BDY17DRAFT_171602 [Neohortaea acidophila]KAF2481806.1 hypothetical protein BDY17DRAFT_171602 [Neohortaea acidophila]